MCFLSSWLCHVNLTKIQSEIHQYLSSCDHAAYSWPLLQYSLLSKNWICLNSGQWLHFLKNDLHRCCHLLDVYLACSSGSFLCRCIWNIKSPPFTYSITRNNLGARAEGQIPLVHQSIFNQKCMFVPFIHLDGFGVSCLALKISCK